MIENKEDVRFVDVSGIEDMSDMFYNASSFNKNYKPKYYKMDL